MAWRILHIMNSLERSGMESMFLNSAAEWKSRGIEIDLLATAAEPGPVAADLLRAGYRICHIPFRSRFRYLPHHRLIPDFRSLVQRRRYDVVHIHTESSAALFAVQAAAAGVPQIVFSVHNTFRFRGFMRARKYFERCINRALGGRYAMVSDAVMECEWERFRNPGVRIRNWLDTSYFHPPSEAERCAARRELDCARDRFVFCTVGNCDGAKNHPALLRALARVKADWPVLLLHVGREQPGAPERRMAAALGLEANTRFEGSRPDPRLYFWAADAFVMPSLHEGLPIAALEAIAAGAPSILTNVPGLDEVASHTNWTILCDPTEPSLSDAIERMIRSPQDVRISRAEEDSARIRGEYSKEKGVEQLIRNLYRFPASDASLEPHSFTLRS
jgi:glycosyltransferase involved in cell wall biosynthesis